MTEHVQPSEDDYELKIDDQVANFLETKQKLSYFLITAAAAVIAFMASFIGANARNAAGITVTQVQAWFVITGSLAGLAAAGATLFSLHLGHRSVSIHLRNRYAHKRFSDLAKSEQDAWDRIIRWASRLLTAAFFLIFVEVAVMVAFFISFLGMRATS